MKLFKLRDEREARNERRQEPRRSACAGCVRGSGAKASELLMLRAANLARERLIGWMTLALGATGIADTMTLLAVMFGDTSFRYETAAVIFGTGAATIYVARRDFSRLRAICISLCWLEWTGLIVGALLTKNVGPTALFALVVSAECVDVILSRALARADRAELSAN